MSVGVVIFGVIAALVGIGILVTAIRSGGAGAGESPKATGMLIGGMMLTAFGLLMAGFSIAYSVTEPANAEAPR